MTVTLAKTPRVTLAKRVNLNKRVRSPRVGSIVAVNLSGIRSDRLFTVVNVAEHNNSVMLADNVLGTYTPHTDARNVRLVRY